MSDQQSDFIFLAPGERPGASAATAADTDAAAAASAAAAAAEQNTPSESDAAAQAQAAAAQAAADAQAQAQAATGTQAAAAAAQAQAAAAQPTYSHEYVAKLDQFVRDGGDPKLFLETQGRDYDAMPDDAGAREQLRKDFPRATPEMIEAYFQAKYKLDPDTYTPQEVAISQMEMQGVADRYRAAAKAEQAKYAVAPGVTAAAQQAADRATWQQHATPALAQFNSVKVSYGTGDAAGSLDFALPGKAGLEPIAQDGNSVYKRWIGADGAPDIQKLFTDIAKLENFEAILAQVAATERAKGVELGKSQGGQSIIDKLTSPGRPAEHGPPGQARSSDPFASVLSGDSATFFTRSSRG